MKILLGKEVCEKLHEEISREARSFEDAPKLLAIVVGDDPSCLCFVNSKGRKAEALGAHFECLNLDASLSQKEIEEEIRKTIKRLNPDGVILERPFPKHIDFTKLTELIPPCADVDCQRMDNMGRLLSGAPRHIPATAGAVLEILKFYDIHTAGKEVVVIGRSQTVGLPLSVLLLAKGKFADATVTVCHSKTNNLEKHTRKADILVAAVGQPKLVSADMVSEEAVIIDVGTTYVDGKLTGDVDFDSVSKKVSAITPVPGGVGPVTTAVLLRNLINAVKYRKEQHN